MNGDLGLLAFVVALSCAGCASRTDGGGGTRTDALPTPSPSAAPLNSRPTAALHQAEARKAVSEAIDSITAEQERALGEASSINLLAVKGGLVLDASLTEYVNDVGNLVSRQGKRVVLRQDGTPRLASRRVVVGVLDDDDPGSWSFPGGHVFVTRGLLELLQSESELAWVLGREIAHIDNEHGLKALKMAMGSAAFGKELGKLGAPGSESKTLNLQDADSFMKVSDKLTEVMLRTGLGRTDEDAADSLGLMYSTAAGYDAQGARRVLELLETVPAKKKLFSTVDAPAVRLQRLSKMIDAQPGGKLGVERFEALCQGPLEAYRLMRAPAPSP